MNEFFLKDIRAEAEINKNLIVQSAEESSQNNNWIKDEDSFLTYSYMKGSFIYKVKFIKTDDGKVLYFKMADSAEIIKNGGSGSKTVNSTNVSQSLSSMIVVVYVPADNPVKSSVV